MPYIKNWSDFEAAATELYTQSPDNARYCVKFKRSTGHLVLRITDNKSCIMYKTFSAIILNRFETLNLRLLSQMANTPRASTTTASTSASGAGAISTGGLLSPPNTNTRAGSPGISGEEDDPMAGESGAAGAGAGQGATAGGKAKGSGGKKKKKGKK